MNAHLPHLFLQFETDRNGDSGQWRFSIRDARGRAGLEAQDDEPGVRGERLALLTFIRALESLDGPSNVTVLASDPYVRQGVRFGLAEWRENGWQWEFYGRMMPIKHADLWQRLDRALRFHQIEFRQIRVDAAHVAAPPPIFADSLSSDARPCHV